ncbi:hypothetical protein OESDEN_13792 [Oesophagostomum dentatum]|uniref:Oxidoreductase, short chain dehydrogenase/reductase family protein n=1 Tax=Oesophagostomum dentatum TaxID=61180 RepID=A0A0B1SND5_OESDE|nr:hypothetical protein OESDEN_13792 [Oesophagostomum dentatum]
MSSSKRLFYSCTQLARLLRFKSLSLYRTRVNSFTRRICSARKLASNGPLAASLFMCEENAFYYATAAVVVATSLFYCRKYIRGQHFTENVRADGKIIAVTGANSGIGQAITAELNRRGATVYMLVRNKKRGMESIKRLEEV